MECATPGESAVSGIFTTSITMKPYCVTTTCDIKYHTCMRVIVTIIIAWENVAPVEYSTHAFVTKEQVIEANSMTVHLYDV